MSQVRLLYQRALGTDPFCYQQSLAEESICNRVLVVPTGSGKTAAAVLTWLHRLETTPDTTPNRMIYCLPMRTLVEQTRHMIETWLEVLGKNIPVTTLMGGEADENWGFFPALPSILIGTQDMLLSRALNRGFAMRRYRWPVHFALMNNDCFWVMDEVQLFGSGLATSTQLQAFRERWHTMGPTATWWMSATLDPQWLATVDFAAAAPALPVTRLMPKDIDPQISPDLSTRYHASKPIAERKKLTSDGIRAEHRPGTLTLVVVNTVARAQSLFNQLRAERDKERGRKSKCAPGPEILLLHSRFRHFDRARRHEQLIAADAVLRGCADARSREVWSNQVAGLLDRGVVCIATQVVEAGLDLSAETLVTELAPWASLVQRFGRCNRFGLQPDARIFWVDRMKKDEMPPYDAEDLSDARERLAQLPGLNASPEALEALGPPPLRPFTNVIRRHDLLGLFSTEPDLAGGFTDVSRFVRDVERDSDAYVFWREINDKPQGKIRPHANEICSVPISGLRDLLRERKSFAWEWNGERRRWERLYPRDIRPGMTILLACAVGGYDAELGWTGDPRNHPIALVQEDDAEPDSQLSDEASETVWVPLAEHLRHAEDRYQAIRGIEMVEANAVRRALSWHDVGKAHPKWQAAIAKTGLTLPSGGPWAKFPPTPKRFEPGLRHEAASALAAWQQWITGEDDWTALAVYLIAAHHGKVRTVLRSRITDASAEDVFGITQGDTLKLSGWFDGECVLDLSPRLFGGSGVWEDDGFLLQAPSWVEMVNALLDGDDGAGVLSDHEPQGLGPFRLAMLEACVVIADVCASRAEQRLQCSQPGLG